MGPRRGGAHHHSHEHHHGPAYPGEHEHEHSQREGEDHEHERAHDHEHPREAAATRWRWKPFRLSLPLTLKLLLGALLAVFLTLTIVGHDAGSRRTAAAAVEITGVELQPQIHPGIDSGTLIRYTFTAGGQAYNGFAIRDWSLTSIRESKVCYEPADPHNQLLVKGAATCPS